MHYYRPALRCFRYTLESCHYYLPLPTVYILSQTASSLVSMPSDDVSKANLSAVAKVLAAQFSQLNALSGTITIRVLC